MSEPKLNIKEESSTKKTRSLIVTSPIILKAVRTRRDASPSRTSECLRT